VTKHSVLGVLVDALEPEEAVSRVLLSAHRREPMAVSALATHGVMTGVDEPVHQFRLNRLDMVVPDGQPVRWTLNWKHQCGLKERVYGPDLMLNLCRAASAEGLSVFLYGSTENVVTRLGAQLKERFPKLIIAGHQASFFRSLTESEEQQIAATIENSGASMVFVGLGCPRQEVWVYENRARLSMPLLAVGAAFDFHAGLKPQAPRLLQQFGLEWLFRFFCEPRRLFQRTFGLYPRFLWYLLLQSLGLKRFEANTAVPPDAPVRFG
jgi:N-acetylglucosaminyldiphosphoundecaprenol N-acetyl-beta-D-mannosaminyltransferase